ncbi:DHA2 family multidrug resistance protein-like MFS transporter [Delftia sp. 60]|uniref:MFS transporter n=1 Tax=Delftia sp. 60 TaxID=2035216 RepID=UPI000C1904AC|nr:MFS transporter [Delftia sp. 60]PIF37807.1 DHA2 family multidrug resistance protein-like MFS transporter [Burkholderiales bacterium 23]PIF67013.1 DHA2 family multidrug resistance protein-like MFS transporter [Delftia sp. 60]
MAFTTQTQNPVSGHLPKSQAADPRRWLVLAIVSVALLLIVIDMTVLYTALPRLTHDLAATASAKLWIVNIYALVVSGLLLGMGTLGDRLGHKRLFMAGLCVFGVASLCAAFAPSPALLIAARALLGVGAAMMMPATLSLIRLSFADERERALAIGIWASVASGGAAFGPVVGGLLLEYFWWGSVFLINVPIVLLALPLAGWLIPAGTATSQRPWDFIGSLQVMAGLVGSTYAIKEAGKQSPDWALAAATLVLGLGFLALFVRRQRRSSDPLLDFALFRNPAFATAVASALVAAAALIGMELVFSQRLQLVQGLSPLQAGLAVLPLPLAAFVAGTVAGHWLPRLGGARMLPAALLLSALGMGGYLLVHDMGWWPQAAALALLGLGIGAAMTTASSTIMQSAPADRAGMAASVEEVSYELGGALGVTLMGSLLSAVYAGSLHLPEGLDLALPDSVRDSLDEALLAADQLMPQAAHQLTELARTAFGQGFSAVIASATLLLFCTALWTGWRLRGQRR